MNLDSEEVRRRFGYLQREMWRLQDEKRSLIGRNAQLREELEELRERFSIAGSAGDFEEGQLVKLRGDMGGFKLRIEEIHNEHYARCTDMAGIDRHVNMLFLKHVEPTN